MKEHEKKSSSRTWIQAVGFGLALVLAVTAFSYALTSMGHKDPGYYEIEAPRDEDTPLYANGITLVYYFDGDSNQIKEQTNALQQVYSGALMRSYKLLDSENTYEGFVNLASLNHSPGQAMKVSQELLAILTDAMEKTRENKGFHMFSGALHQEWESILTLEDISEFVPANNPDMAQRIQALAERTARLDQFGLEVLDAQKGLVSLTIDSGYLDFLAEGEYSKAVLSMNVLTDAYRLDLIRKALEEQGYGDGYLYTDSGLTLNLSEHEEGAFAVYANAEGAAEICATVTSKAGSAASCVYAFPMDEESFMYHVLSENGGDVYYHPYFRVQDGSYPQVLETVCTVSAEGDVVECSYDNLVLYAQESRDAVLGALDTGRTHLIRFQNDDPGILYSDDPEAVTAQEGCQVLTCK